MLSAVVTAVVLVSLSAFLILTHVQKWALLRSAGLSAQRLDFGRRQYRRRLIASFLIGLAGLACLFSPWMLDPMRGEFWWYWIGMLSLVGLLVTFAMLDFWDTCRYFRAIHCALLTKRDEGLPVSRSEDQ